LKKILILIIIILIVIGCKKYYNKKDKIIYPYTVAATVGMVTDIVRNVAGDKAVVNGIINEGIDPHLYKPTRNDVIAFLRADIIFYSGLLLEGKMSDVLKKVSRFGKPVNAVTELIDRKLLFMPHGAEGHPDPHVWMDVSLWMKAVLSVSKVLSDYDPANSDYYKNNAEDYLVKLKNLDEYAEKSINSIPVKRRALITAHDAFNYFGRAYDIKVLGIQGLSTESEAGLDNINRLVDMIVENDIKAIFVESSVSDKNIKALIEGASSRGKDLKIGGMLFSDAMGETGTYEGTYIGMIDHNVTIITNALGGKAPQRGLNNKLTEFKE